MIARNPLSPFDDGQTIPLKGWEISGWDDTMPNSNGKLTVTMPDDSKWEWDIANPRFIPAQPPMGLTSLFTRGEP